MQQQAENIGSEAVTAQAVRGKTILEFFNAVLTLPAIVIEGKNGTAAAFQVGDKKAHVSSSFGVFGLVADAPLMRPAVSTIEKAGKRALRVAGATITSRETTLQPLGLRARSCISFKSILAWLSPKSGKCVGLPEKWFSDHFDLSGLPVCQDLEAVTS